MKLLILFVLIIGINFNLFGQYKKLHSFLINFNLSEMKKMDELFLKDNIPIFYYRNPEKLEGVYIKSFDSLTTNTKSKISVRVWHYEANIDSITNDIFNWYSCKGAAKNNDKMLAFLSIKYIVYFIDYKNRNIVEIWGLSRTGDKGAYVDTAFLSTLTNDEKGKYKHIFFINDGKLEHLK